MPDFTRRKTNAAVLSVLANGALLALKLSVGLAIGSLSVLAEGMNTGLDLLAAVITLLAVRVSGRAADDRHPYGHGKFENLSGAAEALMIIGVSGWVLYEAVGRLLQPQGVEAPVWGVGAMVVSVLVKTLVSRRLLKVARSTDSIALQVDARNLRMDAFSSGAVLLGLLVIWVGRMAWPAVDLRWVDPALAIAVALWVLRVAWNLVRKSAGDLLDVSLPRDEVSWIQDYVTGNWTQVRSLHKLRTRKAGSTRFIEFHAAVDAGMSVGEAHALADEIVAGLKGRFPDSRIQIHIEPCDLLCRGSCAGGCSVGMDGGDKA